MLMWHSLYSFNSTILFLLPFRLAIPGGGREGTLGGRVGGRGRGRRREELFAWLPSSPSHVSINHPMLAAL